ncbi:DUF6234 family protein [Streptomyces sp. NPDC052236]|uniref:DUF6234 family protein n=1 Tax=Streptomyces sp. NPDC052236 TaxID=3365686 RepID=UPI0037D73EEC
MAFDASETPRAGRGADVGAALGLLFLEVLAVLLIFGIWMLSAFSLDPGTTVEADRLWSYLVAAGVIGALALVAAVIASRSRAVVTAWTQCFMAVFVVVAVFGGVAVQQHEDRLRHPDPAPAFTGEVGCRSGGDNSECANTGG